MSNQVITAASLVISGGGGGHGAGQTQPIHIDGVMFRTADGKAWSWNGSSAFKLYLLWLQGGSSAVDAVLLDWFLDAPVLPNTLRVFGMVNSFARLHPDEWPGYYDQLQPFVRYLWNQWHICVEFTIFADAGDCGLTDPGVQDTHAIRVANLIANEPGVFVEVANEPSQHVNLPGGDMRAYEIYQLIKGPGRMVATGAYDWSHPGDYLTYHGPRDPDSWVRKANDLKDGREATGRPTVGDEPMGAAEVVRGGRDNDPRNFSHYAAVAAMEGSGSTAHGDNLELCQPLQPVQRQCAYAFWQGAAWPPPDTQLAPYIRGGSTPGCNWLGESICQHDDAQEDRSYGKILEPFAWVCQVRTTRTAPTPCPGWNVYAAGPSQGLTQFRRV